MKKIIIFCLLVVATIEATGQCTIGGRVYAPSTLGYIKACGINLQNLTDGIVKSKNDSLQPAIAGTDFPDASLTSGQVVIANGSKSMTSDPDLTYSTTTNILTAAGQIITDSIYGSTSSGGNLFLSSTSNATKGKIYLGTMSGYDGTTGFLGIGTQSPAAQLHLSGNVSASAWGTNGIRLRASAATFNDNTSSGLVSAIATDRLEAVTITATSATTYTDVYGPIFDLPILSTGATLGAGGIYTAFFSGQTKHNGNLMFTGADRTIGTTGNTQILLATNGTTRLTIGSTGITVANSLNFIYNTGTGSKHATATNQKMGFWNATPIVQPANTVAIDQVFVSTGFRASGGVSNFSTTLTPPTGTAASGTAPLKFTSGTNLTTPEAGVVEFDGTEMYHTESSVRYIIPQELKGSATLDFPSTSASSISTLTITVTGAADGDVCLVGFPVASTPSGVIFTCVGTAANTVTVTCYNSDPINPANPNSGTFKARVIK